MREFLHMANSMDDVETFAAENDGQCIVANVPYWSEIERAPCLFTEHEDARQAGCGASWEYYFCDEPQDFPDWGLSAAPDRRSTDSSRQEGK